MKRPLLWGAFAFILGEVFAKRLLWGMELLAAAVPAMLLIGRNLRLQPFTKEEKRQNRRICAVLPFLFLTGFLLMADHMEETPLVKCFAEKNEAKLSSVIQGRISAIEDRGTGTYGTQDLRIVAANVSVLFEGTVYQKNIEGILVFSDEMMGEEGDLVRMTGKLQEIPEATNPGQFDKKAYYDSLGVQFFFYPETYEVLEKSHGPWDLIRRKLRGLRGSFAENLEITCGADAGMFRAILLGEKWETEEEEKELFQNAGIGHLLSISGLHLSLLCMGFYRLLRRRLKMHFSICFAGGILLAAAFLVLSGNGTGTRRAVLMFFVFSIGDLLGRQYDLPSAAGLAAILMLSEHPALLYQSGFQLSFAAVLSVSLSGKEDEKPEKVLQKLISALRSGIMICLGTLPILLEAYAVYPLYSVLLNLLVLPVFPLILLPGMGAAIFGGRFPVLFQKLMLPSRLLLAAYKYLAAFSLKLPAARLLFGCPGFIRCLMYYSIFIVILLWRKDEGKEDRKGNRWITILLPMLMPVLLLPFSLPGLQLSFLDVGQGDSCFVKFPGGTTAFIDGGSSDQKNIGENILEPFLKSQAIQKADLAFVSHGDEDHLSGIRELLARKEIGCLVLAAGQREKQTLLNELGVLAEENDVPVLELSQGEKLKIGNAEITMLWPDTGEEYSENEASMVLLLEYRDTKILFPGDLEGAGEEALTGLLKKAPLDIDILKVQHHGSAYCGLPELLDILSPELSVISCGRYNSYGHPAEITLLRLETIKSEIQRTDQDGYFRINIS